MRAVVLGIGNILLSDEGIGVHAVCELSARYDLPSEVEAIDGGVSAMDCLDQIAEADLLLIADCMRSGREPGAISRLAGAELQAFFKTRISPHQVGLSDVLAALTFHGLAPKQTVLIGIEPQSLALGMEPTPELAARMPALVQALVDELTTAGLRLVPKGKLQNTAANDAAE
jgi:hydrogenase maturation protease